MFWFGFTAAAFGWALQQLRCMTEDIWQMLQTVSLFPLTTDTVRYMLNIGLIYIFENIY